MDETEMEQNFDAITMAILHGYPLGAFEDLIKINVNKKLNQVIRILNVKGLYLLVDDIEKLKHS